MKSINTKSTSLIIRQMVLTLLIIFILDLCHICHQDTCSVQKAGVIPKKICIAYPWSAVSILNISERVSLQKFPPGGLFSHIYRPKTIQQPILKYNMDPYCNTIWTLSQFSEKEEDMMIQV